MCENGISSTKGENPACACNQCSAWRACLPATVNITPYLHSTHTDTHLIWSENSFIYCVTLIRIEFIHRQRQHSLGSPSMSSEKHLIALFLLSPRFHFVTATSSEFTFLLGFFSSSGKFQIEFFSNWNSIILSPSHQRRGSHFAPIQCGHECITQWYTYVSTVDVLLSRSNFFSL